ncbi:MAG: flagellar motor protein MotP [Lentisphaerae bacterium GWF2_52_8]|nr:MAG: flagellar motor protein MotP [Lentisphaerae bacterium GWF2_52_8]
MDIGTIIGLVLASGLILYSLAVGPGGVATFIDIPSIMIVFGGTFGAVLITFPMAKVKEVISVTRKVINAGSLDISPWYQTLIELATIARRDGILALEDRITNIQDDFLRRGLQMLVDGNPADAVTTILEMEIENMKERHTVGQTIWKMLGSLAPAFGMIGTLIGLVQMLKSMSDPSSLGAGMAVALITTFYGAVFANMFCIPIQGKLEQRTAEEVLLKKMLLGGILSIQAGDSPRVVGEKLQVYLTPKQRATLNKDSGK